MITDFDLSKRMKLVNTSLCKLFGVLDVLKNVLERAKENRTDIKISPQDFEKILTIMEGVALSIFLSCNANTDSLKKIIRDADTGCFLKEYTKKENNTNGTSV